MTITRAIFALLLTVVVSCGGSGTEPEPPHKWVGRWVLETIDGRALPQIITFVTTPVQVRDQNLNIDPDGSGLWISEADEPYGGTAVGDWHESETNTLTFLRRSGMMAGYVLAVMDFTLRSDGRLQRAEVTATGGSRTFVYRRRQPN